MANLGIHRTRYCSVVLELRNAFCKMKKVIVIVSGNVPSPPRLQLCREANYQSLKQLNAFGCD